MCDYSIIDSKTKEPILDAEGEKLKLKKILQKDLADKQGGICCYCMQSLYKKGVLIMRIEHFKPQSLYDGKVHESKDLCTKSDKIRQDLRTSYTNLFAACENPKSREDKENKKEEDIGHCDVRKDDWELCYLENPSTKEFENQQRTFCYNTNGKIYSLNALLNKEIGGIEVEDNKTEEKIENKLNLNHTRLQDLRKGIWNGISKKLERVAGTKNWESEKDKILPFVKELRDEYKNFKKDGYLYECCDMVVFLLESKFKKLKTS